MKFKVSKTFQETTPESREHGDISDQGYVFEDEIYTLSELKKLLDDEGYSRSQGTNWFSDGWNCYDAMNDVAREHCIFIKLIKDNQDGNA